MTTWADTALAVMNENGFLLTAEETLTRGQVAELLYQASIAAADAPGMAVFRMEQ